MGPEKLFRRRGGLRFYMLWILANRSMNGSEVITEIQNHTMGWWRPSPGSVYPMLSRLENENLILREEDGRYTITERGLEAIGRGYGRNRGLGELDWTVDRILTEVESSIEYLSDLDFKASAYEKRLLKIRRRLDRILKKREEVPKQ